MLIVPVLAITAFPSYIETWEGFYVIVLVKTLVLICFHLLLEGTLQSLHTVQESMQASV